MRRKTDARILPHSTESEQSILGCVLIDQNATISIMSDLKESDFYIEAHKIIFSNMLLIYNANMPVDFVTICDQLEKTNMTDSVGGIEYITTLTNIVPSASNFKHYMDIVKRNSILRQLISAGQEIIDYSFEGPEKEDAISFAEQNVFNIAEREDRGGLTHAADALDKVINKFSEIEKNHGAIKGIQTGIYGLDKITNGFQKSDLVLLAARPGGGKTSLGMNIATYSAINDGKKVAIFSLEMSKEQIMQRALCSTAFVDMSRANSGTLTGNDWKAIWAAKEKLAKAEIYVDEGFSKTPADIISKCRRLKREKGLDLVMIDYLQLMQGGQKRGSENRTQEIGEITRSLKMAARELDVPILLLSQLSRNTEGRKNHRPMPSDLRESGSIEQDADIILFIYNPNMYEDSKEKGQTQGYAICELIIAKHRNGPLDTIKVKWIGNITTFIDIGKNSEEKSLEDSLPSYQPSSLQDVEMEEMDSDDDLDEVF